MTVDITSLGIHSRLCPNPWDDHLDWTFWLQAVDEDRLSAIAQYFRQAVPHDRRVLRALADKLDPADRKYSSYILRKNSGRPKNVLVVDTDPLSVAMDKGDLIVIAAHLRIADAPDLRILIWLADHLDPMSTKDSHFIVKQRTGRPARQSRWNARFNGDQPWLKMLGLKVDLKFREMGGEDLDAALHHFTDPIAVTSPVSRSTARRAREVFLKAKARQRDRRV